MANHSLLSQKHDPIHSPSPPDPIENIAYNVETNWDDSASVDPSHFHEFDLFDKFMLFNLRHDDDPDSDPPRVDEHIHRLALKNHYVVFLYNAPVHLCQKMNLPHLQQFPLTTSSDPVQYSSLCKKSDHRYVGHFWYQKLREYWEKKDYQRLFEATVLFWIYKTQIPVAFQVLPFMTFTSIGCTLHFSLCQKPRPRLVFCYQ